MIDNPREINKALMQALGLSGRSIRELTIRLAVGELPLITTVERLKVSEGFADVLRRFELVERGEGIQVDAHGALPDVDMTCLADDVRRIEPGSAPVVNISVQAGCDREAIAALVRGASEQLVEQLRTRGAL